jgi:hypothetical protein
MKNSDIDLNRDSFEFEAIDRDMSLGKVSSWVPVRPSRSNGRGSVGSSEYFRKQLAVMNYDSVQSSRNSMRGLSTYGTSNYGESVFSGSMYK